MKLKIRGGSTPFVHHNLIYKLLLSVYSCLIIIQLNWLRVWYIIEMAAKCYVLQTHST